MAEWSKATDCKSVSLLTLVQIQLSSFYQTNPGGGDDS